MAELTCPHCGNDQALGTVETIPGWCRSRFTLIDGHLNIEPQDDTTLFPDLTHTTGAILCTNCNTEWPDETTFLRAAAAASP